MEEQGKIWKPPEGKVFDDNMGLVSRAEKIEGMRKYITKYYWIPLAIPVVMYFTYMIIGMFLHEGQRGKGAMLDPVSFMVILLLVIFTHSRIDALVGLLKEQGMLEARNEKKEDAEKEAAR